MTGIENILAEIRTSSEKTAQQNRQNAREQAAKILAKGREDAKKQAVQMDQETENLVEEAKARAASAAGLEERRFRLKIKQQIIRELIDEARESLYALTDEDYFNLILIMLQKYALAQPGELVISQKDHDRLPRGFLKQANASLQGGSLTLSEEKPYLSGGFLLRYGKIEENCTFDALFEASTEALQDVVNRMLFA